MKSVTHLVQLVTFSSGKEYEVCVCLALSRAPSGWSRTESPVLPPALCCVRIHSKYLFSLIWGCLEIEWTDLHVIDYTGPMCAQHRASLQNGP